MVLLSSHYFKRILLNKRIYYLSMNAFVRMLLDVMTSKTLNCMQTLSLNVLLYVLFISLYFFSSLPSFIFSFRMALVDKNCSKILKFLILCFIACSNLSNLRTFLHCDEFVHRIIYTNERSFIINQIINIYQHTEYIL